MKDQIQDIIARFGPRAAGSEAERKAQEYIANDMLRYTDHVEVLPFRSYLTAKFSKMKGYALGYMISLVVFWFSPPIALMISLINTIVLVSDLMRNDGIADFLFPRQTSWNVTATLEPQGEVKSTLIFSGHIDSTHECTWWYRYKQYGAHMTIMAGLIIALFSLYLIWYVAAAYFIYDDMPPFSFWIYLIFVLLSPITIIYFSFHGDVVVEGACDNLSGVVLAKNIVCSFADPAHRGKSTLLNTRLRFISFGAEEKGLRGSTAYIKGHLHHLREENANLINIDSIRLPDEVAILTGEMMSFVIFDKFLIDQTKKAFQAKSIPVKTGSLPMGGTDAIPFQQKNIPALSIIGINMKKLDPTYHTRLDVIDNVDQKALDNVKIGLTEFVDQWDKM